jgi:hypothetical protein
MTPMTRTIISLLLGCSLLGCNSQVAPPDDIGRICEMLRLARFSDAEIVESIDDHGGFHGDGEYWAKLRISDATALKLLSAAETGTDWKPLSGIGDLRLLPLDSRLPLNSPSGIYFFRDFQPEWYPEYESNNRPPHDRNSYNFVFAVFDPETKQLFVYNLDT